MLFLHALPHEKHISEISFVCAFGASRVKVQILVLKIYLVNRPTAVYPSVHGIVTLLSKREITVHIKTAL